MTNEKYDEVELDTDNVADEDDSSQNVLVNYDIASYPSDFTLSGISEMWKQGDIVIPDYQREFVWNINQASLLMDSFLCGLPVPPVFFYIDENNKNLVIDGQQRILSIVYFFEGYFGKESLQSKRRVFRLSGLNEKNIYANRAYNDLDESAQRKLKNSVLRAVNIRQLSPVGESTSAYHIFERLNTGGTPLRPQEIRNCVFRGGFNVILKDSNKNDNWRKIIGKSFLDKHQKDIELLLRIFALYKALDDYEKPMKEFLNQSMKKNDSGKTKKVEEFFKIFDRTCDLIISSLGEKPFHLRGPLNISALDSIMTVTMENYDKISTDSDFKNRYLRLKENDKFHEYTQIGTTDPKTMRERIKIVKQFLLDS